MAQALELGRRYSATVHVEHEGAELQLGTRKNRVHEAGDAVMAG